LKHTRKVVLAAAVLVALPALALAATHTATHIYKPFNSAGKPVGKVIHTYPGSCFGGSDASGRSDAWRCIAAGSTIIDPCFSSAKAKGFVLCPAPGVVGTRLDKIKLNSKLPGKQGNKGKPSTHGLPWAVVTIKGFQCRLETGATTVVDGKRANYYCKGPKKWLYGAPDRKSEPWKIYVAGPGAKHLTKKTGIKEAWF
jgi:hypothetical protein